MKSLLKILANFVRELGAILIFIIQSLIAFWTCKNRFKKIIQSTLEIGCRCVFIVSVIGLFTGMVMGLQMYYTLIKFGADAALGTAVSLSLIRELGPVLTALMIVGQSGSALCSEIGIQRNDEQVDALETMGIHSKGLFGRTSALCGLNQFSYLNSIF